MLKRPCLRHTWATPYVLGEFAIGNGAITASVFKVCVKCSHEREVGIQVSLPMGTLEIEGEDWRMISRTRLEELIDLVSNYIHEDDTVLGSDVRDNIIVEWGTWLGK